MEVGGLLMEAKFVIFPSVNQLCSFFLPVLATFPGFYVFLFLGLGLIVSFLKHTAVRAALFMKYPCQA